MGMTRRQFVESGAAAVWGLRQPAPLVAPNARCIVLDLGQQCSLRESVAGYRSAIPSWNRVPRLHALIVPAALEIQPPAVGAIARCLQAGGTAIVECGAGFADERRCEAHRAALREYLDVHVEPPVQLWPRRVPYIDYTWPHPAKLRDFSAVVPLQHRAHPTEVIASADGLPVGLRRQSTKGTLIFLGSPLGPALWAGDAEALRWLEGALGGAQRDGDWD